MRDQDVLKSFDYDAADEDPYLTVEEVTAALAEHFGIEARVPWTDAPQIALESAQQPIASLSGDPEAGQ